MPTPRLSSTHTHRLLPALHREGVISLLSGFTVCPGLFYATPARDGMLSRIRIPGGIVNSKQWRAIADIAAMSGGGYADVTNRANLQIREIYTKIDAKLLRYLQDLGLGSSNISVDHIRNIMSSPTAGIDSQELIDTRPLVQGWDQHIAAHPHLWGLPAKFSVCFDGGGAVQVCDRPNDIGFAAVMVEGSIYFRLHLSVGAKGERPMDMGILLKPEESLPVLAALADVYLSRLDTTCSRKPRLRELLNGLGCENYLQEVERCLPFGFAVAYGGKPSCSADSPFPLRYVGSQEYQIQITTAKYGHIGVHPQRQSGLSYIGVVLPLGRLETLQIRGLADLAERYGSGTIRLTPWQNLLISDIPNQQVPDVQHEIESLGLHWSVANIRSALVACSGNTGCAASATDTKGHAKALAEYLDGVKLHQPVNIHFTGCEKSCAQHTKSDIALLGVGVGYHVYVGDGDCHQKFGRELYQDVTTAELPALIEQMLTVYKIQRLTPDESFGEFANRHAIAQLQQLFSKKLECKRVGV